MRLTLAIAALLAGSVLRPHAMDVTVDRIEIGPSGLYTCNVVRTEPDLTGGAARSTSGCKLIKETQTIPAKVGTRFGCSYKLFGIPAGARARTIMRWHIPKPGITNPANGNVFLEREYNGGAELGGAAGHANWTFDPGETVLGRWSVDIVFDAKVLGSCTFNVIAP